MFGYDVQQNPQYEAEVLGVDVDGGLRLRLLEDDAVVTEYLAGRRQRYIGPLKLRNPVLTASGTFGYGEEYELGGVRAVHPGIDLNLASGGDSDLGAPVVAALRTASADGGVTPWSIEATMIASITFPTASPGSSPRRIRYIASPNEMRPIISSMR